MQRRILRFALLLLTACALLIGSRQSASGILKRAATQTPVGNAATAPPAFPRHYSHIRLAALAWNSMPLGAFEDELLRNSIDLVISDNFAHIKSVSPATPGLLYTNTSSLYQQLLVNWLAYADAHKLDREGAFYHATRASDFTGAPLNADLPSRNSTQPVTWFWHVALHDGNKLIDFTRAARRADSTQGRLRFADRPHTSIAFGYPERFREINFEFASGAGKGWTGALEYADAVAADGQPVHWTVLTPLRDTTGGFTRSGQVTFDPPADWKPASPGGSRFANLYYVRLRTSTEGIAPVAATILGRDYVGAKGGVGGVIPTFDKAADSNHDRYLDDKEYARRTAGKDARFFYESRLFYWQYGQMRFQTNPADAGFKAWAVAYSKNLLLKNPLAAGLFMDNSQGRSFIIPPAQAEEDRNLTDSKQSTSYSKSYGLLLREIRSAIAPKWILPNTDFPFIATDDLTRETLAYYDESSLRPFSATSRFLMHAEGIARRAKFLPPGFIGILDSYPKGGDITDPRTQITTLAYYYLIADPASNFLCVFCGFEPDTEWRRHWFDALKYDVGRPVGDYRQLTTGSDPTDPARRYAIFQREYDNALVLYKPMPLPSSLTDAKTATTHELGKSYYPLAASGVVGAPVTNIALRNGEGVILINPTRNHRVEH